MSISSSTCHICLDELDFDLRYLKKKCCPSKAFICNECWEKILSTEEIIKCPLCNERIKEEVVPKNNSTTVFPIDIESHNSVIVRGLTRKEKLNNWFLKFVATTCIGFLAIILVIYLLHSKFTTFEKEVKYVVVRPFFWLMCYMNGFVIICLLDIICDILC